MEAVDAAASAPPRFAAPLAAVGANEGGDPGLAPQAGAHPVAASDAVEPVAAAAAEPWLWPAVSAAPTAEDHPAPAPAADPGDGEPQTAGRSPEECGCCEDEAAVTGTVFADPNLSGRQDAGESGLAGVAVFLATAAGPRPARPPPTPPAGTPSPTYRSATTP